jgi:predicted kinase
LEAIIFCGIQGAGKSHYFIEHFYHSHVRISLDLLKTRNRESKFLELCLKTKQKFVIDNTNPTKEDRMKYLVSAKKAHFKVICYFFYTDVKVALDRNSKRIGKASVPPVAIYGTLKKFQPPVMEEGFDEIIVIKTTK